MKPRPWFAEWRVWVSLLILGLVWLVGMPFRILDWLLSIFR